MQSTIDEEYRSDSFFFLQAKQLNGNGELFRQKYPKLRVRLVDGSGLATGVVLKSIPLDAKQVFLHTGTSKIARAIAMTLCGRGIQVYLSAAVSSFICNSFVEYFAETSLNYFGLR
jgi:ActR/RegA family two-component response regulator